LDAHESSPRSGGRNHQEPPTTGEKPSEEELAGPGVEPLPPEAAEPLPPAAAETPAEPDIMERLPRSRPKPKTPRRAPARAKSAPARRAAPKARGTARPRAGTRTASAAPRTRAHTGAPPVANGVDPAILARAESAPGLPRLALDGAIEAAKLPIKVGTNITFRALDAVTKSLRRR
jgi:hypothetical protein